MSVLMTMTEATESGTTAEAPTEHPLPVDRMRSKIVGPSLKQPMFKWV